MISIILAIAAIIAVLFTLSFATVAYKTTGSQLTS